MGSFCGCGSRAGWRATAAERAHRRQAGWGGGTCVLALGALVRGALVSAQAVLLEGPDETYLSVLIRCIPCAVPSASSVRQPLMTICRRSPLHKLDATCNSNRNPCITNHMLRQRAHAKIHYSGILLRGDGVVEIDFVLSCHKQVTKVAKTRCLFVSAFSPMTARYYVALQRTSVRLRSLT